MSDDLDTAFTTLREHAPVPRFMPATAVRRRGRRRSHRRAAVAGVAVVGVLGGAGAAVAGPYLGGRSEPTNPGTAATGGVHPLPGWDSSLVPDTILLQPDDLPQEYRQPAFSGPLPADGWPDGVGCRDRGGPRFESQDRIRSRRGVAFPGRTPRPIGGVPSVTTMGQSVHVYESGWAGRSFNDLDDAIARCERTIGSDVYQELARDVGGDESRLYRVQLPSDATSPARPVTYLAVVRVGDRVTTLRTPDDVDESAIRDLVRKAADRLRTG